MASVHKVLVVGCGMAGAALVRRLAARGIAADAVDLAQDPAESGSGILLTGNAMVALDGLGVGDRVRALGRRVNEVRFADRDDADLFRLCVGALPGWPEFHSIHRSELMRILLQHAPAPAFRLGVTVDALENRGCGVRARFSTGESADYDVVIGADGVGSRVRALAFGEPAPAALSGFRGWRFIAKSPTRGVPSVPTFWLGNGQTLLIHPLGGGAAYCGAGPIDDACAQPGGSTLDEVRATYRQLRGTPAEFLAGLAPEVRPVPTRYWQVSQVAWRRGRCLLIGDAAHACAPTLAQGAALAFEDALVLADLLADGRDVDAALDVYERSRRPRVEAAQRESSARMQANRRASERAYALRSQILRAVGAQQLERVWAPLVKWGGALAEGSR